MDISFGIENIDGWVSCNLGQNIYFVNIHTNILNIVILFL